MGSRTSGKLAAQKNLRQQRSREQAPRRWQKAIRRADALGVSAGTAIPSDAAAAVCRELADAGAECAAVGLPGSDWAAVQAAALRRATELTLRRLTVAQRRRRQREQAGADLARNRAERQAVDAFRRALRDL